MFNTNDRIIILLVLSALLASATLQASEPTTVYKVISPDGSISFSDEPKINSEAITLKPVTTIPAINIEQNKTLTPKASNTDNTNFYQTLSIVSPRNNTAFNSGNGTVKVIVQSQPPLRNGDSFKLELDSQLIAMQRGTSFILNTVDRGTHILTVSIIDRNQKTLKIAISTITVHRPIARPFSIN